MISARGRLDAVVEELRLNEIIFLHGSKQPLGPKITALKARAVDLLTKKVVVPRQIAELRKQTETRLQPKTVAELIALYGRSQVEGDDLPDWVKAANDVLEVHLFGNDAEDWASLIVVSPTMKALIRLDPGAKIDLAEKKLELPRFGQTIKLTVHPKHLE